MSKVLVTGGSGFIASHCILGLLAAGHRVRATVRSLERAADVRKVLERAQLIERRVNGTRRPCRLAQTGIDSIDRWLDGLRKAGGGR